MLNIQSLSKTYANGVHALRGVSLSIPRGLFGLLGPNGAGKSSLMRTLATLQDADSGSVTLDELDVLRDRHAVRQRLGYLPQDFGVYPRIDAHALLTHFASLKGIHHRRERAMVVEALLRLTNLWDVRKQNAGTFSGGMRQRFGIAQALLGKPQLIIVDEPTAGLDPEERRRFLNLLARIGEQAVVILSTHFVEDVRELCSTMAVIDRGRILVQGEPDQLISGLQGRIWERAAADGDTGHLPAEATLLSTQLNAGRTLMRVECPTHPGQDFKPARARLEDVYFSTLKHTAAAAPGEHLNRH